MTNIAYVDNLLLLATDTPGDFVGIGTTMPQGKFHVDDTTGSMLFCSKSGIVGSTVTIVADGASDVTKGAMITGVAINTLPEVVQINSFCQNGGSFIISSGVGSNTLTVSCSAAGALTVVRTLGTATWTISVLVIWQ